MFVGGVHGRLPTMCWLPVFHRPSNGPRFVASSGSCTAAELSILLTSCLAAVGGGVIKCCTTVFGGVVEVCFGLLGVLGGLESGVFWHLVCLHVVSLLSVLHCLVV